MKRNQYSNWRNELREVVDIPSSEPKTETKSKREIKDKKVNNKVVINPTMQEAIEEIGGTLLEVVEIDEQDQELTLDQKKQLQMKSQMMKKQQMLDRQRLQAQMSGKLPVGHAYEAYYGGEEQRKKDEYEKRLKQMLPKRAFDQMGREIDPRSGKLKEENIEEVLDMKKADMGDVVKDFYKSDAPQFKGKSKEKRRQMAIAAKLEAERGPQNEKFVPPYEPLKTTEREIQKKKKREMMQKTRDHDAKMSGRMASEENINELNRYEKETGTSSGSMNMPKGRPTQKGGELSPAMRAVRQMMRSQTGKPMGQRKPSERPQPKTITPAQKVANRRAAKQKAIDNMSSRYD